MRIVPILLLAVSLALPAPGSSAAPDEVETATPASVLLTNVGNVNPSCGARHVWKLCHVATEDRIADNLRDIAPDLAVLIEVMPDAVCEANPSASPFNVCSKDHTDPQVERLVGDGYSVTCGRYAWDCLAVRDAAGTIDTGLVSLPDPQGCDDGFVVGFADVTLHGEAFRVLLGHPDSMDADCRHDELEALLGEATERSLLIGDMNLDPNQTDASADLWNATVGPDKDFAYHSDPDVLTHAPSDPSALDPTGTLTPDTYNCAVPFPCRSLDHVGSNFASGGCGVLGETDGTERLDGGGGADHRAVSCTLFL